MRLYRNNVCKQVTEPNAIFSALNMFQLLHAKRKKVLHEYCYLLPI